MKQIALDIGLRPLPSLDSFWSATAAQLLPHLRERCQAPGHASVPTYLWGTAGSGKTHLLLACRAVLHAQGAATGWLDATLSAPPAFDEAWCAVLLDDVQAYSAAQQQTAFNWFVNASTRPCWVLAAGTLPPADLPLREDLRSRLGWGHVHALPLLGDAERAVVLRQAAQGRGLALSDEVLHYMLSHFSRDLGTLMHWLERLDRYALQSQRAITIPLLKAMLESD